jgi:hypothetical protein
MSRPYTIAEDGKSITCHACGRTSYNMNDVANCYCGNCHVFFEVGLSEHRQRVDELAQLFTPALEHREKYILLLLKPDVNVAGDEGLESSVVSNLPSPEATKMILRELLQRIGGDE